MPSETLSEMLGVFGFHVFPRLSGQESRLSSFMEAGSAAEFSNGGVSYRYTELSNRKAWLDRASRGDTTMAIFESLYRNDEL